MDNVAVTATANAGSEERRMNTGNREVIRARRESWREHYSAIRRENSHFAFGGIRMELSEFYGRANADEFLICRRNERGGRLSAEI